MPNADDVKRMTQPRPVPGKGVNPYAYARNNPLMYVDPDGRDPIRAQPKANDAALVSSLDFGLQYHYQDKDKQSPPLPPSPDVDLPQSTSAADIVRETLIFALKPTLPSTTPDTKEVDMARLRKHIEQYEGRRAKAYDDGTGRTTVGVGHNLMEKAITLRELALISGLSATDYDCLLNGSKELTDQQINQLLELDISISISDVRKLASNYDDLPAKAKEVLIDMHFNMGSNSLRGFSKMIAALQRQDFETAAKELFDSNNYGRSPLAGLRRRAADNRDILKSLAPDFSLNFRGSAGMLGLPRL